MTKSKDEGVAILVNEIKDRILSYYKEYEELIDNQLDSVLTKLTKLNNERMHDVNETESTVIDVVQDDSPVLNKIEKIKGKFQNIYTKMEDDYSTLLKLSNFDHLTSIFNRRQFDLHIEKACSANKGCFLIMIDIDDFKEFNDNYGHAIGDQALKLVASFIKKISSLEKYIPFRYGGEEFVILCPNSSEVKSFTIAEKLRKAVSKHPFMVKDDDGFIKHQNIQITISIGITKLIENDTPNSCVERADRAMYYSKKTGKNKTCSYEKLEHKINNKE